MSPLCSLWLCFVDIDVNVSLRWYYNLSNPFLLRGDDVFIVDLSDWHAGVVPLIVFRFFVMIFSPLLALVLLFSVSILMFFSISATPIVVPVATDLVPSLLLHLVMI